MIRLLKNPANIIVGIIAIAIFISPIIINYSTLPKGFELPKVIFFQVISVLVIILYSAYTVSKQIKTKIFFFDKSFIFLLVTLSLFILSTILSPFQDIVWFGNTFRLQGLITHLLIIILAYIVFKLINKYNWHLISLALFSSALIQAFYGIYQFITIIKPNPSLYLDGLWVGGTFGQTNWFSGRILLGIIFGGYYLTLRFKESTLFLNILKNLLLSFSLILMIVAISFSRSIWAMIIIPVIIFLILTYELINKQIFPRFFRIFIFFLIIISIFLLANYHEYNIRIHIWQEIIYVMFQQPLNFIQIKRIVFGFGFDSLAEVFTLYDRFGKGTIDRAHNFILDILIQNGVIIFIPISLLLYKINSKLKITIDNRIFAYSLIALFIWAFRSIIHESGIVNMIDFLVLLAIVLGLTTSSQQSQSQLKLVSF